MSGGLIPSRPLSERANPLSLTFIYASPAMSGKLSRIRIQAEADLAAAFADERRSPIDEEAQPLTCFLRADPAEKRGTLPPAMVMRSPVRGLTP